MGCAAAPSPKEPSLDEALQQSAEKIEERLESGTKVALINVRSPSDQFSEYALTYLESILVNNGKLIVVDRSNLDKIRQELGFQLSGEVSDESANAIGKMLGAGAIITGTLIDIGGSYRLTLKAINVETATVAASYPSDIANNSRVKALLASGNTATAAAAPAGRQTPATAQSTTASQPTPAPAYKIGDTGPAGGLIFLDKGNSTGGWRYLEAAPQETEKEFAFGDLFVGITGRKVGDGKENTDKFLEYIQQRGGVNTAVWYCGELEINGYDDWYLPSTDELLYIYNNLYLKNIGGFKSARYKSSTFNSATGLRCVNFNNGEEQFALDRKEQVRAVRRF